MVDILYLAIIASSTYRYWLPSFLKHTHVALRFLPQSAYEHAAPLDIVPAPAVVTRVFMLFKGVPEDSLADWPHARSLFASGERGSFERWADVVGVDLGRALDERLFRVLEWGGMEVLRA